MDIALNVSIEVGMVTHSTATEPTVPFTYTWMAEFVTFFLFIMGFVF